MIVIGCDNLKFIYVLSYEHFPHEHMPYCRVKNEDCPNTFLIAYDLLYGTSSSGNLIENECSRFVKILADSVFSNWPVVG